MLSDLKNSIIFLHGLSGSGKGEIQRKLAEQYSSHDYNVSYLSSGALFRAALSNPTIAEQVRSGYFLDTLGAIMPGIENAFESFIKQWAGSDGKAIIILDGLIRRGSFTNKDGVAIPSQVEQISVGIKNVIKKLFSEDRELINHFPEYSISDNENGEKFVSSIEQTLRSSTHIVADVLPEDAEAQMKRRANKEIEIIRSQLQDRLTHDQLNIYRVEKIESYISKLEAILYGGIKKDGEKLVYTPRSEWNDQIDKEIYSYLATEVKQIREDIANTVGLETSASLSESFESINVFTELRDDDISPIGRKTRIDNYIKAEKKEGKRLFEAGFATQALNEDLDFQFTSDGSFISEARNCIVIANGQGRGIGLEQFQTKCKFISTKLYEETESRRETIFENKEGRIINREKEF